MNIIHHENCITGLKALTDSSIDCCVTSPPYFGLRDYGHQDQIGLEETPEEFIENLVKVFREVKRVMKPEGTLWLNIGDSYFSDSKGSGGPSDVQKSNVGSRFGTRKFERTGGIKPKDMIGIPWMLAFALRSDGWYLRQDIIWHKPNPMPESVTDRCTKSHEYIFLLSKSKVYYYDQDAIKTPLKDGSLLRLNQNIDNQKGSDRVPGKTNGNMKPVMSGRLPRPGIDTKGGNQGSSKGYLHRGSYDQNLESHSGNFDSDGDLIGDGFANKKSVWTVATKGFNDAHFATFPEKLIVDCIKAGCPENGIVLDPFMGSGTTAVVAKKLNRNYVGYELNIDYLNMANKRLYNQIGMFL